MDPFASVIIPTRNGMPLFEGCLTGVFGQQTRWPFEVIVVDSCSTDGTWELARARADLATQIKPADFNHGTTRNFGARLARGSFLVFLVQDAIPADERWLTNLVSACERPGTAGSYSRQVVRPDSDLITHFLCDGTTPTELFAATKSLPVGRRLTDLPPVSRLYLALFQNASSCLRREMWEKYPFAAIPYGEDIEWGKRVIEAGYAIAYDPGSVVFHSHDRSPKYYLKRAYADHYQAAELFDYVLMPTILQGFRSAGRGLLRAWTYGFQREATVFSRWRFLTVVPIYVLCLAVGQYLGPKNSRQALPVRFVEWLDKMLRAGV